MAFNYRAQSNPTSQQAKPQASMQASTQPTQQPSPSKAPDMSVYAQPAYNSSNVPRTPPKGAQQNDLSGQVPSNQIWAQAYNQASKQYGGNTQAQSFTMPGTFTSQGYNPTTGQYGQMTGGQSNAGNMAYNAIDQRPGPIQASATGVDGSQMPWQDTLRQGEAFVGNLSQRLGQYSSGQLTGPVTFDQGQLMQQANDQLANGSFYNPFSQQNAMQNPDVQRAMGNATQYMQGDFQNPFGPQANVPQPSFNQQSYDPRAQQQEEPIRLAPTVNVPARPDYNKPYDATDDDAAAAAGWQKGIHGGAYNSRTKQYWDGSGPAPWGQQPTDAQRATIQSVTDKANAQKAQQLKQAQDSAVAAGMDPAMAQWIGRETAAGAPKPGVSRDGGRQIYEWAQNNPSNPEAQSILAGPKPYGYDDYRAKPASSPSPSSPSAARPIEPPSQGTPYNPQAAVQGMPDVPSAAPPSTPRGSAQANPVAPAAPQRAQIDKINNEINKWERATYGTRQGGGPPAEWRSHIQALKRLRAKAEAGDPAALAWSPKMQAPSANATPTVTMNRRGNAARFGSVRQNGDNLS